MKRFIFVSIIILTIFSFTGYAIAEEPVIKVALDGQILIFDQNPIMQNGRVLVPLRKIFESLGAAVSWDSETQTITVVKEGNTVKLTVGSSEAYINNLSIALDQPPVIVNARTLVPVRFVSEALGANVEWEQETQTVQIYSKDEEGISCSTLGMIPNDATKGVYNYDKLIAEVKKGTTINVDGIYHLATSIGASSANEANAGLSLIGSSPTTSKLILDGGTFFTVKGKALIENISIESPTDRMSYLINMNAPFVNEITVRNNYVTGNIRLVSSSVPLNFNFTSTPCYINNLTIENNEFYDVYNNGGSRAVIYVNDTPVKSAYIRNNKVTNFSYVFYSNAITNGNTSNLYLIGNTNAVIENNIVVCTDDYNAVARNGGTLPGYYCFALIEGFNVECRGNTFEGFHISDAAGSVVYDNYFNVTKLLYENNTWKNNVNFTPGLSYVDIMKSKFGAAINGVKTERIYRNNTYIVEPSYADRFGKDRFLLRKEINTWQGDMNSIIIEDNYFDMYILSFGNGVQYFKDLYKFNRNTILMDTVERSINRQVLTYVKGMKDASGNFIPRNLIFTNNTIICDSKPFSQGIGTEEFYLIFNNGGVGDKTTVDFSNNNIKIPDFIFGPSSIVTYSSYGTIINFLSNKINGALVAI